MKKAGSKRKTAAPELAVHAKRSASTLLPEEAAVLRTMASSLNTITHALMALPTPDVAARSRVTADLAEYKRQLNSFLGIKQRVSRICRSK